MYMNGLHIYVYVYICVVCICIYIHILCVCVYTYIHTHTHTCTHQTNARLFFYIPGLDSPVNATSVPFEVTIGNPLLALTTQPSLAVAGKTFVRQPVVRIHDLAGNVMAGSSGSVEYLQVCVCVCIALEQYTPF